jgi:hypothetical protein
MNLFYAFPLRGRRPQRRNSVVLNTTVCECLEVRQLLTADPVIQWNHEILDAIRLDRTSPPVASRAMAIMHTAIFDAVNSIERDYQPFLTQVNVHPRASVDAAVASAGYYTLTSLFPAQKASFDTFYADQLALIPNGISEDQGVAVGKTVAQQVLASRSSDGALQTVSYAPSTAPGDWKPTAPAFAPALLPHWGNVDPWSADSLDRYQPSAPPSMTSREYTRDFNEVKAIGSATSTTRTADQTQIAKFWANGAGTSTPPGHWNIAAGIVSEQRNLTLAENARLFALLNVAMADSAVLCWTTKYEFEVWRPITAIQMAATDGNPATAADPSWQPLLVTPPFPSYTSGHSTFSGAAAAVLTGVFGTDRVPFTLPSETPGVADRKFRSFSQAADESGVSRIYGGIHYGFDNTAALRAGRKLGEDVAKQLMRPYRGPVTASLVGTQLQIDGTPGSDTIIVREAQGRLFVTSSGRNIGQFSLSLVQQIMVSAGDGNDLVRLAGVYRSAEIYGGDGNDLLIGGSAADRIFGDSGRDVLIGNGGADTLDGGSGRNRLFGNRGADTLFGIQGLDRLFGGKDLDDLIWRMT